MKKSRFTQEQMILPANSGHATKRVNSLPEVAHMTKSVSTSKKPRKQHTREFRNEALKLAERIGVAAAARELSLYKSQLYTRPGCIIRGCEKKENLISQRSGLWHSSG